MSFHQSGPVGAEGASDDHNSVQVESESNHVPMHEYEQNEHVDSSQENLSNSQESVANCEESASHIAFWSTRTVDRATYFQIEIARRASSMREKEARLQREEYYKGMELRQQEKEAQLQRKEDYEAMELRQQEILDHNAWMTWKFEEQSLSDEEQFGHAHVAEEDIEKMREAAVHAWNSEESDRIYDLTMFLPMQYFLDAESWSENLESYWSDKCLVTNIPETALE